jgi:hypothetical protein
VPAVRSWDRAQLQALVAAAVVDAYNHDERLTGLYMMIEDSSGEGCGRE